MALNHIVKGSVNYTIVGALTIVDEVASGFSSSNGLVCQSSIASTGDIEFNTKINVQDFSSANPIFKGAEQYQQLAVRTTGEIVCSFGLLDGNWRLVVSTYRISANATYTVNVKLENNTCHIKIYDANNQLLADEQQSFTYQYKATSYMEIGRGPDNTYFKGSIDLKNTYIKVNGAAWFGNCPVEVKKHQLMGPVEYTVVGSPTISNGIASGLSDGNYVTIQPYIPSGNMEAQVSFVYASSFGTQSICTAGGLFSISAINNNLFSYDWTYNNWRNIINGATDNTKYKIKIVRNNDVYTFSVSEDDGPFVEKMSFTSSAAQNTVATLGASYNSTNRAFGGSINLNETYIKENGKLWFWQPRETERIVVNDVEVWTKPA